MKIEDKLIEGTLKYLANDNTDYEEEGHTYKILELDECELLINYIADLQKKEYNNSKAKKFIEEKISSTQGVINDYMYHQEHNKILIELLREDIELYKKELNILEKGE